jgi:hypothetical protein
VINFRYHIVSLMAVFLALSVGIVLGVTLRGPVNKGLATQAEQDRRQVTDLRAELDRRDALDDYREAWAQRAGTQLTSEMLAQRSVVLVAMPEAPSGVVDALSAAVTQAGGTLTHTVKINADVFDPSKAAAVSTALQPFTGELQLTDSMSPARKFGLAVGRANLSEQRTDVDATAVDISEALTDAGLVTADGRSKETAELAIVVTDEATEPQASPELLDSHVDLDVALKSRAAGVVVAGPNSENIQGTDVLSVRNISDSADLLSTVDVADLSSGVATTIMAGKEQLLGRHGHYGALTKADAPMPQLPVR